jgi:hypothetical protein
MNPHDRNALVKQAESMLARLVFTLLFGAYCLLSAPTMRRL